jgi:N-acetyl-anhydromuramyl-L-alanine amidase AmpD
MDGAIIVGGEKFVMEGVECHTWHDHGLKFDVTNSAVARRLPPRWLVYHWTASERDGLEGATILHRSLLSRKTPLSVEFFIDNSGVIYQFADPNEVRCRHASRINELSIGVEVSCVGWDKPGRRESATTESRPRYISEGLHGGWKPTLYDYFPAQVVASCALADAVCRATGISRKVELDPWDRRPRGYFDANEGVCGHLHCASFAVKNPKIDPGTAPLRHVAKYFNENP